MGATTAQRKCKICHNGPRDLPDRESGSRVKSVCKKCHANRLLGDLRCIAKANQTPPAVEKWWPGESAWDGGDGSPPPLGSWITDPVPPQKGKEKK